MIAIITGNYQEYRDFILMKYRHGIPTKDYFYVQSINDIRSNEDISKCIRYGSWPEREDYDIIFREIVNRKIPIGDSE